MKLVTHKGEFDLKQRIRIGSDVGNEVQFAGKGRRTLAGLVALLNFSLWSCGLDPLVSGLHAIIRDGELVDEKSTNGEYDLFQSGFDLGV